jgi:hypothetical protein
MYRIKKGNTVFSFLTISNSVKKKRSKKGGWAQELLGLHMFFEKYYLF